MRSSRRPLSRSSGSWTASGDPGTEGRIHIGGKAPIHQPNEENQMATLIAFHEVEEDELKVETVRVLGEITP
jgi:hypothetical protein